MLNFKHYLKPLGLIVICSLLYLGTSCKSTITQKKVPFSINEKTYFQWVGGKEGTRGTTITIKGFTQTTNLSFSKIYFQNHEYDVVPQFNGNDFVIAATMSEFHKADRIMSGDPVAEYGNRPPQIPKKIPFDLKNDEAVILYSVNGQESYHKISEVKKLETIYRP